MDTRQLPKFEYWTVVFENDALIGDDLNIYGSDGWELVAVIPHPHDTVRAFFKRPIPEPHG